MSEVAIAVQNLSKRYAIGVTRQRYDTLRDCIAGGFHSLFRRRNGTQNVKSTFWALKDISLEVKRGEVVGIIGPNGAGKSTLLKILSRITSPTEGRARICGRVGSLLEVGTGFHPELTGRENIYLNGAILGMKRAEIARKFDEIVAFSEIERFVDTPVKRYSSGMYVRLAFGVAAHLEPEILIVDEVLAVGDAGFQRKCLGRMQGVAREGRTVLFVSHNMSAVEALCNRVCLLREGRMRLSGSPKSAIERYLADSFVAWRSAERQSIDLTHAEGRPDGYRCLLRRLELFTENGRPLNGSLRIGEPLKIRVSFCLERPTSRADIALGFDNHMGQRILTVSSMFLPRDSDVARVGDQTLVCDIPSMILLPGEYSIKVILDIGGQSEDAVLDAARFEISPADYYGTGHLPRNGTLVLPHKWYFDSREDAS
jgi:lipopolysaccharide transport system ATP-binding protein